MMKIGCVGVGQAGLNLAYQFSSLFPTIVADTAPQNLNSLKKEDSRKLTKYHVKINEWGGAGKDAILGLEAFKNHKKDLTDLIKQNFSDLDYVWITAGLGGGTGTLGCTIISNILHNLGKPHGMLLTLPDSEHEGTDEITNSITGLNAIENARKQMKNLRSIILVENEKLKKTVMNHYDDVTYENLWEYANKYVFDMFYNLYYYSQQESAFSFDGQDYVRLFLKSGYMCFGNKTIEDLEKASAENSLVNHVKEIWDDNIFVKDLNISKAKGSAVIVNRPKSFDKDGILIDSLFNQVKNSIGSGTFAFGVYKGVKSKNMIDKFKKVANEITNTSSKSVEVFTLVSGMPFPKGRAEELKTLFQNEVKNYNDKNENIDFNLDINEVKDYLNEYKTEADEDFEFDPLGSSKKEKKKLAWDM